MPIKFLNSVSVDQDVLYVDGENNRVGIGTTEPSQKLEVTGNGLFGNGNTPITLQVGEATGFTVQTNSTLKLAQGGGNFHEFRGSRSSGEEGSIYRMQEYTDGSLVRTTQTYDGETTHILYGDTISLSGIETNIFNGNIIEIREYIDHDGDDNTRFGFPTIDTFAIDTNGSERMRITSTGNVGIGTTGPRTKLHVSGLTGDDDPSLGASTAPLFVSNTANSYGLNIGVNNVGAAWLQAQSNTSSIAYNLLLNPLGGNVGIGVTSPQAKLHVQNYTTGESHQAMFKGGAVNVGDYSYISLNNGYSTEYNKEVRLAAVSEQSNANKTGFAIFTSPDALGASGHERLRVTADGDVGIGTDNPNHELVVQGASSPNIELKNSNYSNGGFVLNRTNYTQQWKWWAESNQMYFSFATDESTYSAKMTIQSDGDVGIGTTSPGQKLEVEGNIRLSKSNDATSGFELGRDGSTLDAFIIQRENADLFFRTNNSERMRINSSGNVGIGDTNPDAKLTVFRTDSTYAVNLGDTESRAGLSVKSSSTFDSKLTISAGAGLVQQIQGVNNAATASRNITINPYGGNVGIGKTNAVDKLDVGGNIRTSGYILVREDADNGLLLDSSGGGYISGESDESITLMIRSSGASYLKGGDVGIGTSGPNSKLHVLGGIQLANDTTAASASKVGTLRYYTSGNNSYVDMCMQTGAATYAWVNIVTNSW